MDCWLRRCLIVLVPAILFVGVGCGGRVEVAAEYPPEGGGGGGADITIVKKTFVKAKGRGMIKGQVTFDGEVPGYSMMDALKSADSVCRCATVTDQEEKQRHTQNQQWLIDGKTKGVSDVLIYVEPLERNQVFPVTPEEASLDLTDEFAKKLKLPKEMFEAAKKEFASRKLVQLNQPHCVYEPHALVLFPMYYTGDESNPAVKKLKQAGFDGEIGAVLTNTQQTFEVTSTAPTKHNTQYKGEGTTAGTENPTKDEPVKLNTPDAVIIPPQKTPVQFGCSIHAWMDGKAIVLSHPYSARSDKEGKFLLPLVPAGTKLRLLAWHDGSGGWLKQAGFDGEKGKIITVEPGKTLELNFQLKKQ